MSLALLIGLDALALIGMYLYFSARIDRRLDSEKLLDKLREDARRVVGEMIQDLNRITDRNITLMETHVTQLQAILDTAEKRILFMQKQVRKEEAAEKLYEGLRNSAGAEEAALTAREENAPAVSEAKKRGQPERGGASSPRSQEAEDAGAGSTSGILTLYRTGLSPELIAKKLNLPAGEVRLVISLYGSKGTTRE